MSALAPTLVPDRRRKWKATEVPYLYGLPKANCYATDMQKVTAQWTPTPHACSKDHCCDREITANGLVTPQWV